MLGQLAAQSLQQAESKPAVVVVLRPLVPQTAVFCTGKTSPSDTTVLVNLEIGGGILPE